MDGKSMHRVLVRSPWLVFFTAASPALSSVCLNSIVSFLTLDHLAPFLFLGATVLSHTCMQEIRASLWLHACGLSGSPFSR